MFPVTTITWNSIDVLPPRDKDFEPSSCRVFICERYKDGSFCITTGTYTFSPSAHWADDEGFLLEGALYWAPIDVGGFPPEATTEETKP